MTRYRLDLPVTFRWMDQEGHQRVGAGFTHDVNAAAIFVYSSDFPPQDEIVHCELKLPRLRDEGCLPVSISGRVVRVEQGSDWRQHGFVVRGELLGLCQELWPEESEGKEIDKPTPPRRPN